jgi:hypothetical protein
MHELKKHKSMDTILPSEEKELMERELQEHKKSTNYA